MYSLEWHDDAAEEAQQLFFTSDPTTRQQVSEALAEIDARLSEAPLDVGESRSGNDRVGFLGCLAIQFAVDEARQIVAIYRVHLFQRRK
jgi:hypothetical protein